MKFVWEHELLASRHGRRPIEISLATGMKIIIEPSSALPLATILGGTLGGSEDAAEWKRIVQDIVRAKSARGDPDGHIIRIVVIITGGNVSFKQVLRMFENLEKE
jgi:hypothetical protein